MSVELCESVEYVPLRLLAVLAVTEVLHRMLRLRLLAAQPEPAQTAVLMGLQELRLLNGVPDRAAGAVVLRPAPTLPAVGMVGLAAMDTW